MVRNRTNFYFSYCTSIWNSVWGWHHWIVIKV